MAGFTAQFPREPRGARSSRKREKLQERGGRGTPVWADLPRDEAILRAAAETFYRCGFDGTTLDDIARDAGIGRTSLYHYFDSKEEIYERLVNNVIGSFDVQEELSRDIPAEERLERLVRARLEQTTTHPIEVGLISRRLVRMEGSVGEWARRFRRREFDSLRELIMQGQRDRRFRDGDPDIMAATVMGLMVQVCEWYRPSGRVDRQAVIDEMARFIVLAVRER